MIEYLPGIYRQAKRKTEKLIAEVRVSDPAEGQDRRTVPTDVKQNDGQTGKPMPRSANVWSEKNIFLPRYFFTDYRVHMPGKEIIAGGSADSAGAEVNHLALGDNLPYMAQLLSEGFGGRFQFLYIDPPFSTGMNYNARVSVGGKLIRSRAYRDKWEGGLKGFLSMLCPRLLLMKELLSKSGTIAVHLDRHAVHYVKILMDEIFGEEHFVNELIWSYKSGGSCGKAFAHKHDTILVYSKTEEYTFHPQKEKSYNRQLRPYNFKGVEEYRDETGWYTLVNRKDVLCVDMVGRSSAERTGYATQKPEALLKILLESFTDPGDLCGDFFSGSGTLGVCASGLGRRFVCCDRGAQAFEIALRRLAETGAGFTCCMQGKKQGPKAKIRIGRSSEDGGQAAESLEILSYTLTAKTLKLTPQEAEGFEEAVKKDRTVLLDLWAEGVLCRMSTGSKNSGFFNGTGCFAGFCRMPAGAENSATELPENCGVNFSDSVFLVKDIYLRNGGKEGNILLKTEGAKWTENGRPAILAMDAFGGTAFTLL